MSALERGARRAPYRATIAALSAALGLSESERAELEAARAGVARSLPSDSGAGIKGTNLPLALSSFVGRDEEIAAISHLLQSHRHITLTGPGGVGKSRLALETARHLRMRFPDGVWLVELATLSDAALVPSRVAGALGITEQCAEPLIDTIISALCSRHMLLILDNCEHLVNAAAVASRNLLENCPKLRILATSREPLRIPGERIERVDTLSLPESQGDRLPSIEELLAAPAVRLFFDRADDVDPDFTLHNDSEFRRSVQSVCRRLDGIPLAIELAAARMSALSLTVLAQRLDDRFRLLTVGSRTALPRHQTLRATLDWSHALLLVPEKRLFRRIGIFVDGWTLPAAHKICADDMCVSEDDVFETLSSLVDKSLVVIERRNDTKLRYRMLETIRSYALDHLEEVGERQDIARRHADYFRMLAEHADETTCTTERLAWIAAFEHELDNFRAALSWCLIEGNEASIGAALAGALGLFFVRLNLGQEAARWCEIGLARLVEHPQPLREAALYHALARAYNTTVGPHQGKPMAERAVMLYREAGDRLQLERALIELGEALLNLGRQLEAEEVASEALGLARELGNSYRIALALRLKANVTDPAETQKRQALLAEALDTYRAIDDVPGTAYSLCDLSEVTFAAGDLPRALAFGRESVTLLRNSIGRDLSPVLITVAAYALMAGDIDEAASVAREALTVARRFDNKVSVAWCLQHLAGVQALRGAVPDGAMLFGAADAEVVKLGLSRRHTEQCAYDWTLAVLRASLSEAELAAFLSVGRSWNVEFAIEQSLRVP